MRNSENQRYKRIAVLAITLAAGTWLSANAFRDIRHHRLNGELIRAIKARNDDWAVSLLREGADGTASENDAKPITLSDQLRCFKARLLRRSSMGPGRETNLSALTLYYNVHDCDSIGSWSGPSYPSDRIPLAILATKIPINEADECGRSALSLAAGMRHDQVVRILVQRHADVNHVPDRGMDTPLMAADATAAGYLMDHGANINLISQSGNGALFGADDAKAEVLLQHGAKIDSNNYHNQTPMIYACLNFHGKAVKTLLAHYQDDIARATDATNALLYAVRSSSLETVECLVAAGGNIKAVDSNGASLLALSLDGNDSRVFDWLLTQHININARSKFGATALDEAKRLLPYRAAAGKPDPTLLRVINKLIERGAQSGAGIQYKRNTGRQFSKSKQQGCFPVFL